MMKGILALAFAMTAFAGVAQAAEFRIGAGTVYQDGNHDIGNTTPYFDTYPGVFCGTKAIKISVLGSRDNSVRPAAIKIGRVYLAYQTPAEKGPFSAYLKVNTILNPGESTAWLTIPKGDCLKKVRVYAEGAYGTEFGRGEWFRVVVSGQK